MRISQMYRPVAVVVFAILAADRPGAAVQMPVPVRSAVTPARNSPWVMHAPHNVKNRFDWVITTTQSVFGGTYIYDELNGNQVASCYTCGGGYGAAADNGNSFFALGSTGLVTIYRATAQTIEPVSTLTLTSGSAMGLAFDSSGNLYATDWPSSCWDTFTAAAVASGGASSGQTCNVNFSSIYNLATYGTALYVAGQDAASSALAIGTTSKLLQDVQTDLDGVNNGLCAAYSLSYPGGVALTKDGRMVVNNALGCVTIYKPPYDRKAIRHFSWVAYNLSYSGIAIGKAQNHIWGAGATTISTDIGFATEWNFAGKVLIPQTFPMNSEYDAAVATIYD